MKTSYALLAAAALVAGTSAHAAPVISESFSQPAGSLGGATAGTGLSGTWSTNQTINVVNPPTLSYGNLVNSGGQADLLSGNGVDAFVSTSSALSDNGLLNDGSTLWFSFMFAKTASGGSINEKAGFALGTDRLDGAFDGSNMTNGGNGIGILPLATNIRAATWSGSDDNVDGGASGSAPITLGESLFVVGRIDWGATSGDDETITMYLPSTLDLGNLGPVISTATMSGIDQTAFDTISMTQRNSGGTVSYDEIRFGTTYADVSPTVIPSPTAFTAGLGLAGLLVTRRRRRNG